MSKNFEEEYKALANEELPDLWNRIEAGLTPKTTALAEEANTEQSIEHTDEQIKEKTKKGKVISFLYRYRTVAAAALCAVAIIPAVIVIGFGRAGRSKMWESANGAAPMELYNSAAQAADEEAEVTEEAAEEEMEFSASETAGFAGDEIVEGGAGNMAQAEACDVAEEATADSSADAGAYDRADAAAVDDAEDSEMAESATAMMTDAEKKMQDKEMQELSGDRAEFAKEESRESERSIRIYEDIVLKVTEITEETVSTDKNIFYGMKVRIVQDPTGELAEGTEITVWVACTSSMAYLEGTEYVLNLSYSADRKCPYRIV